MWGSPRSKKLWNAVSTAWRRASTYPSVLKLATQEKVGESLDHMKKSLHDCPNDECMCSLRGNEDGPEVRSGDENDTKCKTGEENCTEDCCWTHETARQFLERRRQEIAEAIRRSEVTQEEQATLCERYGDQGYTESVSYWPKTIWHPAPTPQWPEYTSGCLPRSYGYGDVHTTVTIRDGEPESVAQEAHRVVNSDRAEAYGHPIFDMTRTADMLTAILRDKLRPGTRLEAEDVCQAMICVKQSRERNKPKRDNQVDIAGYALVAEKLKEWRDANPGIDPRDRY